MKYLIWLVVAVAVVVWLKRLKKTVVSTTQQQTQAYTPQRSEDGERMVQCAHCGIHFPASEAVSNASGAVFCSTEHRNLSTS